MKRMWGSQAARHQTLGASRLYTHRRHVWSIVIAAAFYAAAITNTYAATIVTYTGNYFDFFSPTTGNPWTTADRIIGTLVLANPLSNYQSLPLTNVSSDVSSFSFSDGVNTFSNTTADTISVLFSTDASGAPTNWSLAINRTTPQSQLSTYYMSGFAVDQVLTYITPTDEYAASVSHVLGIWSVAETPLPPAITLFASGLGALGLLGWRRKKKAATLAA